MGGWGWERGYLRVSKAKDGWLQLTWKKKLSKTNIVYRSLNDYQHRSKLQIHYDMEGNFNREG